MIRLNALATAQSGDAGHHGEVLGTREEAVDGRVLPGEADRAPYSQRIGPEVMPGDRGGAGIGPQEEGSAT